jgi:hypothetical protein
MTLWSDGIIKSAASLESLLTEPYVQSARLLEQTNLVQLTPESIRDDDPVDLQDLSSCIDEELEQLYARVSRDSDTAAELAGGILIPRLEGDFFTPQLIFYRSITLLPIRLKESHSCTQHAATSA